MSVVQTPQELTEVRGSAFVPTMGALHEGHLALIRRAAQTGKPVLVSIFVNPTQFGPNEDFQKYPRQLERDVELASDAGADVVFAPSVETMYPEGERIEAPPLPTVATQPGLEDRIRPGHFRGVCQVVARLFDLVQPGAAVFGEKDYQQLLVIRSMVQQQAPRWGDLEVIALPTVHEPDGLAMSSRNAYLSEAQREHALGLSRALAAAGKASSPEGAERRLVEELARHELDVDYAVVRHAGTLMPIATYDAPARALIAARTGDVRLIDNAAVSADARSGTR